MSQTKLQLDRIHPVALEEPQSAKQLREDVQALLDDSVECTPEGRKQPESKSAEDKLQEATNLREQIQMVLHESSLRALREADAMSSRAAEPWIPSSIKESLASVGDTSVQQDSTSLNDAGVSRRELKEMELKHKCEMEKVVHDNAKLEITVQSLQEQLVEMRRMQTQLLDHSSSQSQPRSSK